MSSPSSDPYILNLEKEKHELQLKMEELRGKIFLIDSLIHKRRAQLLAGVEGRKITRKNADRLFYESLICDIIKLSKSGVRTSDIQREIQKRGHRLNYNTLRSYIVEMRDTKRIKKNPRNIYNWIMDQETKDPRSTG